MVQTATQIDWAATGTIVAAAGAFATAVWTYFGVILSMRKEFDSTIAEINNRLVRMETKMELFWNAVVASVSSLIKQPIHFRKDELMDKLIPENLPHLPENTVEELLELKHILKDELVTLRELKDPKSLAYGLAIAYIDQILYDKGLIKGECK